MVGLISVLVVLALSILVNRIAAVALVHTGLSREAARFQARSAFTGVGYTTDEAEMLTAHPVRRRIVMLLMLLGNAGIVTVVASLVASFVALAEGEPGWIFRGAVLGGGIALLWFVSASDWVDRWLSAAISRALHRWSDLEVRDYAALLHLAGNYRVRELKVGPDDWIADASLAELGLRDEGVTVLSVEREEGEHVGVPRGSTRIEPGDRIVLYGRAEALSELDVREKSPRGDREHREAVAAQEARDREAEATQEARVREKDAHRDRSGE